MATTIKYVIFFGLLGILISQFLPVVDVLPFGIDDTLVLAIGTLKQISVCMPFLDAPWQVFKLSIQLLFLYALYKVLHMFLTRGKSGHI